MGKLKILVSAVSSEFKAGRELVASDLRAKKHFVHEELDFRQEIDSDTTLRMIHNLVRDCDAVVAVVGKRSGSFPPPFAAKDFQDCLIPGLQRASHTQYEVLFARKYNKRLNIFVATDNYVAHEPQPRPGDDPESQKRLAHYLCEELQLNHTFFSSDQELARHVNRLEWGSDTRPKPKSDRFVSIGGLFKGRDEDMRRLRESLAQGGRTAVTAKAIHGLGGVGKTRLALEYGIAHEADYSALLFLAGETPAALEKGIQDLGPVLGLEGLDNLDEDRRRAEILGWFRVNPDWFLVVDNIDTPEALGAAEGILANLSHGHTVITSRLSNFSGHFTLLELDVLGAEDAVAFLLERTKDRRRETASDKADAQAIAEDLGRLALALEQAGAYVCKRGDSLADYRREWERASARLLAFHDATVTGYPRAVAVTWATSVAQLSPLARELMEMIAFLAPEPVPKAILDILTLEARDAFDELAALSLVMRDRRKPYFAMHRLVQEVTRPGVAEDARDARITAALQWLYAATAGTFLPAPEMRQILVDLALHVEALAGHAEPLDSRRIASYLLAAIGDAYLELGWSASAFRAQSQAKDIFVTLAEADPDHAGFQHDLSVSYIKLGDLAVASLDGKAARDFFEKALAVRKKLAEADPDNAGFQRDLIVSLVKLAESGDAPAMRYAEALAIAEGLAADSRLQGRDQWMVDDLRQRLAAAGGQGARNSFGSFLSRLFRR